MSFLKDFMHLIKANFWCFLESSYVLSLLCKRFRDIIKYIYNYVIYKYVINRLIYRIVLI